MFNSVILAAEAAESKPSLLIWLLAIIAALFAASAVAFAIAYFTKKPAAKVEEKKDEPAAEIKSVAIGKVHEQGKRQYQQDSFGVSDTALMRTHGVLAIVADGMGGLADGDKVSSKAAEKILDDFVLYNGKGNPEQVLMVLAHQAVSTVNELLGEDNYRKSGSTLVMGLIKNSCFSYVSVGDSRICLFRNGILTQLNREHIYKNELVLRAVNGEMPIIDAYSDKSGSGLTSYLGMGELRHIDFPASPIKLLPGDKVMLMSDGIYNALTAEEISRALVNSPEEAAEMLREAIEAKAYSNQDNYTGIILECRAESEDAKVDIQKEETSAPRKATAFPKTEQPD